MTAPVGTIVEFDAYTVGLVNTFGSWSHTVGSGDDRAILVFAFNFGSLDVPTCNGTPMDLLADLNYFGAWPYRIFGLLNPSTGSNTLAMTTDGTYTASVSYSGVASFGDTSVTSPAVVDSALGDTAVMSATALDTDFANRGAWVLGHVIEDGWGDPSVTGTNAIIGVNLVAAEGGGGGPAPSTTSFAGFF